MERAERAAPASPAPAAAKTGAGDATGLQYLTFLLGGEEYGVDILRVQEIKAYAPATRIPNAPEHVRGVMNLRGVVVPVVDLRVRFALGKAEFDRFTVVVVVQVAGRIVGLVVDSVSDVLELEAEQIEAPPELGSRVDTSFIRGIARKGDRLAILLDLEALLGADELTPVGSGTAA